MIILQPHGQQFLKVVYAHSYYAKYIVEAQEKLGAFVVSNDTWYIGTHLKDANFEKCLNKVMAKIGLTPLAYTVEKAQV